MCRISRYSSGLSFPSLGCRLHRARSCPARRHCGTCSTSPARRWRPSAPRRSRGSAPRASSRSARVRTVSGRRRGWTDGWVRMGRSSVGGLARSACSNSRACRTLSVCVSVAMFGGGLELTASGATQSRCRGCRGGLDHSRREEGGCGSCSTAQATAWSWPRYRALRAPAPETCARPQYRGT